MAKTRSEAREKIMIILYQIEIYKLNNVSFNLDMVIKENVEIENDFIKEIVYGVTTKIDELDVEANKYLKDWDIKRIDRTGASILRIALYEIKYTDTPQIVVINEAIELAKKYSDDSVRKIINAVLDRIINE